MALFFWAKTGKDGSPGVSVRQHLLCAGAVGRVVYRRSVRLFERYGLTEDQVVFLIASHDVGKIQRGFQGKCPEWLRQTGWKELAAARRWNRFDRHEVYSGRSLALFLHRRALCGPSGVAFWSAMVGGHHGKLGSEPDPERLPEAEPPDPQTLDWERERQSLLEEIWNLCGKPALPDVGGDDPEIWLVAGLIVLADWIASDERFFAPDKNLSDEAIPEQAERAVQRLDLAPLTVRPGLTFEDLFRNPPYAIQTLAAERITGPGVHVLEAPMGLGKTEAALWAAYKLLEQGRATGIYFALPTQATSNRMHLRLKEFASRACPDVLGPRLIHGNAWLLEDLEQPTGEQIWGEQDQDPDIARNWFASARRALLAPLGVGTVDQALLAVVHARHFPLRRFALAGKVVVLDEVHSYDVFTGTLITVLCRELVRLGCTVIVLSATLTARRRAEILGLTPAPENAPENAGENYPLLTCAPAGIPCFSEVPGAEVPGASDIQPKPVSIRFASRRVALERCRGIAEQGGLVLWVCDTVDSAQTTYAELAGEAPSVDLGLLHSRFPVYRREELEDHWLERFGKQGDRTRGAVLVATQVVEQSVDIDADLLITELAPTDMLLQRLGRLQRHVREDRAVAPECLILEEAASLEELRTMSQKAIKKALGNKAYVYQPYALLRTLEVWKGRARLDLPGDIRGLLCETYAPAAELPPAWEKLREEADGRDYAQKALSRFQTDIWNPALQDREDAHTRRFERPTVLVSLATSLENGCWTMLNGEKTEPDNNYHLPTARALHRNAVRLPGHILISPEPSGNLKRYGLSAVAEVRRGEIHVPRPGLMEGYALFWDELMGVRIVGPESRL